MEVSVEPNPKIEARSPSKSGSFRTIAVESLTAQAESLNAIASRLGNEFDSAVELILACQGRTIISGMGKSGLIAKKIAATFASTGTPSFFIHPAEAFHGDLGMITQYDLLILISYSGETEEVCKLLPSLKHFGNRIISLSGHRNSTLAQHSDISLDIAVEREVCPNNLAPTTSTLATMAMGDALAVALIHAREFKPDDFARYHPGGNLGRRLLLFNSILSRGMSAVSANRGLFGYRQVKPMDAFITRAILEWLIYSSTYVVFLCLAAWFGLEVAIEDPLSLIAALVLLFLFSSGLALMLCVLVTQFPEVQKFLPLILRPLYFMSGIFFSLEAVPHEYRPYLLWNPILHANELSRVTMFKSFETTGASWEYLASSAILTLTFGMMLYRQNSIKLVAT